MGMDDDRIDLDFNGYWRQGNRAGIPATSGVYAVYSCRYNQDDNTVTLKQLIYFGEAENARDRISGHEKWPEWREEARDDEICFSFAQASEKDRERAEAALIHYHRPVCNQEYKDRFPFKTTTVQSTGKCALVTTPITVRHTHQQES